MEILESSERNIESWTYVRNEHQIEVGVAIDCELNSSFPHAWYFAHININFES